MSGAPASGGNNDFERKRDRKFNDKRDEKNDNRGYDKPRDSHPMSGGSGSMNGGNYNNS
jgi:hypothetical protein